MSDPATPEPDRPSRRTARRWLAILAAALAVLLVLVALLYLNRRMAARQVLVGWLEQQGVEADIAVERVELDSLVASLRIGDPDRPDVVVERVEVDFALGAPWSRQGLGLTPSRIRLLRPVVRASLAGGKLSLGSLDPLIERFTARPPRPDARGPIVLVEQARVRLATDWGPAELWGDAHVDDGKLMRLSARLPAADLRSGDVAAQGLQAQIQLTTTGDRTNVRLTASAVSAAAPSAAAQTLRLTLAGDLPYPDLKARRGDGQARLRASLDAGQVSGDFGGASGASLRLAFQGRTAGWIEDFRIEGDSQAEISLERVSGASAARTVRIAFPEARTSLVRDREGFGWRIEGPAQASAATLAGAGLESAQATLSSSRLTLGGRGRALELNGPLIVNAQRLGWGDLELRGARASMALDLVSDGGMRVEAAGRISSSGGRWPLLGLPARQDGADLAAMKRALGDFSLDAPSVRLSTGTSGTRLMLDRPVRIRPRNGGELVVAASASPLFSAGRGQLGGGSLTLSSRRGPGLPDATVSAPEWRLTPGGFTAVLQGRASLDFDLARGITLETRGRLTSDRGRLTYAADGCTPVAVERLELGENDVFDVKADLCPTDRPLVEVSNGGWRSVARLASASGDAPFLALGVRDGAGRLAATGGPSGIGLRIQADQAGVVDLTSPQRFSPVSASGSVVLQDESWSGGFDLSRLGARLGRISVEHDGRAGVGGLVIDAPSIAFTEDGLQPGDLSPLVRDIVGSPAVGTVGFTGRVDWSDDSEGSSSGRLVIPRLDFVSPVGPVKGLSGDIEFTNLAPLSTAPDQRLHAEQVDSVTSLTDVDLAFGLNKDALVVRGADLNAADGVLRIEAMTVPLDPSQPFTGVLVLEKVQLGKLMAGSGLGEKVRIDAVVSGRLPFTWDPAVGLRVTAGELHAIQPGRLSIQREALSGLEAGGGGEGVPENTVQDLAYQAMENLSFDLLSAEVNSLDAGRLGVLFRIRGRHDPPQHQELRIPIDEFISREFLDRELPLPSGTSIDLTLDTTLNANQLVSDLLQYNRARNGEPDAAP